MSEVRDRRRLRPHPFGPRWALSMARKKDLCRTPKDASSAISAGSESPPVTLSNTRTLRSGDRSRCRKKQFLQAGRHRLAHQRAVGCLRIGYAKLLRAVRAGDLGARRSFLSSDAHLMQRLNKREQAIRATKNRVPRIWDAIALIYRPLKPVRGSVRCRCRSTMWVGRSDRRCGCRRASCRCCDTASRTLPGT